MSAPFISLIMFVCLFAVIVVIAVLVVKWALKLGRTVEKIEKKLK